MLIFFNTFILFKKLHISVKPEKILTYILYAISIVVAFFCLAKILSLAAGNIHMSDNISIDSPIPYIVSIIFIIPALAFSYYVNSRGTEAECFRCQFAAQSLRSHVRGGRSCFAIRSVVKITVLANAPGGLYECWYSSFAPSTSDLTDAQSVGPKLRTQWSR